MQRPEIVGRLAKVLYEHDASEGRVAAAILGGALRWDPWDTLTEASRTWWYDEAKLAIDTIEHAEAR